MNIKLISPRSSKRPMDSDWKTRMSPPLSLLVLGALTPREHEVCLADENTERVRLDDAPDLVGLTVKVDTVHRAAEIARAYRRRGIMVNASLVFGFDGDDESVFPTTLDWLVRQRVATMTAHIMTPYPGTRLYDRLQREGRILDRDLRRYDTAHAVFAPSRMSAAALERGHRWIYDRFYSWANILRRMPADARQRTAFLEFNLLYRKYGKLTCHFGRIFGMRRLAKLAKALAYPAATPADAAPAPTPHSPPIPVHAGGPIS